MPSFVLKDAKYVILTYSQVNSEFDYWAILDTISALEAECIIAKELHQDGGTHFHVFVDFGRKFSTRCTTTFDVCDHHPNITKCGRTPWLAFDYCCKDGEVLAGGATRPEESTTGHNKSDENWEWILDAGEPSIFWDRLRSLYPRTYVVNYPNIQRFVDWKYKPRVEEYVSPPDFTFDVSGYPELADWAIHNLRRVEGWC